jgi:hypothetical protein
MSINEYELGMIFNKTADWFIKNHPSIIDAEHKPIANKELCFQGAFNFFKQQFITARDNCPEFQPKGYIKQLSPAQVKPTAKKNPLLDE